MNHNSLRKTSLLIALALLLCLWPLQTLAGADMALTQRLREKWADANRHVVCFQYEANEPALVPATEKINQAILETAHIQEYEQLLFTVAEGGVGLTVETRAMATDSFYQEGTGYLALLVEAKGKMLQGPPSHRYYPMVFDGQTGERVTFDQLFADPEGAKAYIEQYLTDVVEPQLSTYLENSQLFPVPYESFGFSGEGHLILYYPHDQLSFLSGTSGAVAFRYSELWDYLDTSETGIALQMVQTGNHYRQYADSREPAEMRELLQEYLPGLKGLELSAPSLGTAMELIERDYALTTDSGFYPGGAYYETETPELLGTYLITDEAESYVSGILTSRVDMYGIETGKTTLSEAKRLLGEPAAETAVDGDMAEQYLVCPGTAARYVFTSEQAINLGETGQTANQVSLTVYADESGMVRYIRLSLE